MGLNLPRNVEPCKPHPLPQAKFPPESSNPAKQVLPPPSPHQKILDSRLLAVPTELLLLYFAIIVDFQLALQFQYIYQFEEGRGCYRKRSLSRKVLIAKNWNGLHRKILHHCALFCKYSNTNKAQWPTFINKLTYIFNDATNSTPTSTSSKQGF